MYISGVRVIARAFFLGFLVLALPLVSTNTSSAAVKVGDKCPKASKLAIVKNYVVVCTRVGNKLVWKKQIADSQKIIPTPKPLIPTPKPQILVPSTDKVSLTHLAPNPKDYSSAEEYGAATEKYRKWSQRRDSSALNPEKIFITNTLLFPKSLTKDLKSEPECIEASLFSEPARPWDPVPLFNCSVNTDGDFVVTIDNLEPSSIHHIAFKWKFKNGQVGQAGSALVLAVPGVSYGATPSQLTVVGGAGFITVTWDGKDSSGKTLTDFKQLDIYIDGRPFDGFKPTDTFLAAGTKTFTAPAGLYILTSRSITTSGTASLLSQSVMAFVK